MSRPSPVEAVAELGRRALHTDDVDEMLRAATEIVGATLGADRTVVLGDGGVRSVPAGQAL